MIIDFHSHILPGVDDGSTSVEESLNMLRVEVEQGIQTVIATPHFYARHDTPKLFLEKRGRAEEKLRQALLEIPDPPEVLLGAEVFYFSGISDSDWLSVLTIGSQRCMLLEMPQPPWTERMYKEIEAIHIKQGITPIIAHIDRYIRPFRTFGIPQRLEQLPVLVQANASFFLRPSTRNMALRMLCTDQIHLLGSDCHNLGDRSPKLGDAVRLIQRRLPSQAIERIEFYQDEVLNRIRLN